MHPRPCSSPGQSGFITRLFTGQLEHSASWDSHTPHTWQVEVAARLDALTRLVVVHTGHGTFQARQMNFDVIISSLLQSSESEYVARLGHVLSSFCGFCGSPFTWCFLNPGECCTGSFPAASPALVPERVLVLLLVDKIFFCNKRLLCSLGPVISLQFGGAVRTPQGGAGSGLRPAEPDTQLATASR